MRIKSLAQGENILVLRIEPSTFVSKVDILTTTPIVHKKKRVRVDFELSEELCYVKVGIQQGSVLSVVVDAVTVLAGEIVQSELQYADDLVQRVRQSRDSVISYQNRKWLLTVKVLKLTLEKRK